MFDGMALVAVSTREEEEEEDDINIYDLLHFIICTTIRYYVDNVK